MKKTIAIAIGAIAITGCNTAMFDTSTPNEKYDGKTAPNKYQKMIVPDLIPNKDNHEAYTKFNQCLSDIDIAASVMAVNGQILKCREAFRVNIKSGM